MDAPVAVFKKRAPKGVARKAVPPPPRSDSDSDFDSGEEGDDGRVVKRRKIHGNSLKASSTDQPKNPQYEGATKYQADKTATIEASTDATKQTNWYEEDAEDALSSKNLLGTTRSTKAISLPENIPDVPARKVGPVKESSNVRMVTFTDYTPDVCKDYKQTGFCGFGDGCKFLHAREDYAAGWKLDRDWEISTQGKKQQATIVSSANREVKSKDEEFDVEMLDKIPFACIICKQPYKSPIVTKCTHYFCESCALKRYRKDPTCAACGEKTNGVFNSAKILQRLLDKKRRYEEKKKQDEENERQEAADDA